MIGKILTAILLMALFALFVALMGAVVILFQILRRDNEI